MTAADVWLPALGAIEERVRLIGDGFGVEVALVWPLVASLVVEPSATHDLVSARTWRS